MTIKEGVERAYKNAKSKGFHDKPREIGTALALIHSEVSEALEAHRKSKRADLSAFESFRQKRDLNYFGHVTERTIGAFDVYVKDTFEDEMADIVIRVFDLCGQLKIDLEKHVKLKMEYNESRQPMHGKAY